MDPSTANAATTAKPNERLMNRERRESSCRARRRVGFAVVRVRKVIWASWFKLVAARAGVTEPYATAFCRAVGGRRAPDGSILRSLDPLVLPPIQRIVVSAFRLETPGL